ncbi:MAG: SMC family ATPase [Nocardioides sp.]
MLSLVEETACSHDEAEVILAEARASAAVDTTDRHELAGLEVKAVEAVETARLAVEDAKARLTAEQAIGTYDRDLAALDAEASRQAAMADSVPEKLRAAQESLHESRAAADRLEATSARVRAWQQRADAAERAERLRVELVCAHEARQDAVDRAQAALDVVHDVRERRLSGMAAEIAGGLAVGCSCPVCGSADHPRPAEPEPGAPAAEDERAARKAADDANAARHLHEEHCRDLTTTLALAKTQADGDRATIAEQLAQARAELDLTQHTADRLAADQRAYDALLTQSGALDEARRTLELKRVGMESARATMLANRDSLDARIRQAVPDVADGDPSPLFAERTEGLAHLRQVIAAMDVARTRRTERRRAHRALMAALAETPFACADEARGALCTPEVISRWQEQVTAHDRDVAQVEALLADPELVAASTRPAPDLDVLRAEAQAAEQAGVAADTSLARSRERLGRLSGLRAALDQALSRWAPLLDDVALATSLSQFVDGKSADNLLQMRLSAYVLAYRLTQVVEAANARLLTMSDSRYSLEHSDQRGAGETRGGLSLLVRDDWTGESRDPGTLSGGETFVVSLALALGLADTLTQQSDASAIGDSRLDTLFVDEGFGSLDADTLEDVMNTLDGLREGGRVVGVVSHVAEMHDRIPTRLEVVKGRRGGSTVRASIPVVDATS